MSQPLYFLSGVTRAQFSKNDDERRKLLHQFHIEDIFGDVDAEDFIPSEITSVGPDGETSGVILAAMTVEHQPPQRMGFYPEGQDWKPSPAVAEGKLWIGLDKIGPVAPSDLRRKTICTGCDVKLEDGNNWHIPVIRRQDGQTELPQVFSANGDGDWKFKIREKYMAAWNNSEISSRFFFFNQDGDTNVLLDICIEALAINYRIDKALVQRLEILGSSCWEKLLSVTVDFEKVLQVATDMQKKNQQSVNTPNSVNCTPGQPAGSITPTPVEATSTCDQES